MLTEDRSVHADVTGIQTQLLVADAPEGPFKPLVSRFFPRFACYEVSARFRFSMASSISAGLL